MSKLVASIAASEVNERIEVLVSWNGKDEPPFEFGSESSISVHYYQIMPYNFSKNNNQLSKYAAGEILLFINDDIILDRDCLQRAVNEIRKPEIGIVGANLRYLDGTLQHAGVFFREDGRRIIV